MVLPNMKITRDKSSLSFSDCLHSSELKKKTLFTLLFLALYKLISLIAVPFIPKEILLNNPFLTSKLAEMYDLFTGGTLTSLSILSLGIGPYISASIIIQLWSSVSERLKALKEEGSKGREKLQQITWALAFVIAVIEAIGLAKTVCTAALALGAPLLIMFLSIALSLTLGAAICVLLSELISKKGIGSGSSLLICVGIVGRIPMMVKDTITALDAHITSPLAVTAMLLVLAAATYAAVLMQKSMKRLLIVGGKAPVGKLPMPENHLYLPVNPAGVMPIIFASQTLFFLQMLSHFVVDKLAAFHAGLLSDKICGGAYSALSSNQIYQAIVLSLWAESSNLFDYGHWEYYVLFTILILTFSVFYTDIVLPPKDIAENLRSRNKIIAGVRPGRPTLSYLKKTCKKLALVGAAATALISLIPTQVAHLTQVESLLGFGSTSLFILTGVVLDTQRQMIACVSSSKTHRRYLLTPPKVDKALNNKEEQSYSDKDNDDDSLKLTV